MAFSVASVARGLSISVITKARTSSIKLASGTDFSASPASTASGPVYHRAVSSISLARWSPTRRRKRKLAQAGTTPASLCTSPTFASLATIMKSQPSEISKPPARV